MIGERSMVADETDENEQWPSISRTKTEAVYYRQSESHAHSADDDLFDDVIDMIPDRNQPGYGNNTNDRLTTSPLAFNHTISP